MSVFMSLPRVEAILAAERFLETRKTIPGGYSGMHVRELALALQRAADDYLERQYQLYASLDP